MFTLTFYRYAFNNIVIKDIELRGERLAEAHYNVMRHCEDKEFTSYDECKQFIEKHLHDHYGEVKINRHGRTTRIVNNRKHLFNLLNQEKYLLVLEI